MATHKVTALLATALTASAAVLELPVHIQNTYCTVDLNVGTPAERHRLMFDTGSSSAWFVSTQCSNTSCPNSSGYSRLEYNASASSTSVDLDSYSSTPYVDGDYNNGFAKQDVFSDPDGTIEWNQTFVATNSSSWRFITADGFLGLGFSSIAENKTSSLVETLLWDDKLDDTRFGLFYGTNLADNGTQDGVLTIGGSHEDKYVDDDGMVYAPLQKVSPYELWLAPLRSMNVLVAHDANGTIEIRNGQFPTTDDPKGSQPKTNTTWDLETTGTAVFDTGAGRVSVPADVIGGLYYNLGWSYDDLMSGQQRMGCEHLNASWAISFTLGEGNDTSTDVTFTMRGDEFIQPDGVCMPPVDNSGGMGFALVGAAFLRRHYSVFDFGATQVEDYQPRIGFGRLRKEYDYMYQ